VRRNRVALAARHRRPGTPAFQRAGALGSGYQGSSGTGEDPVAALGDLIAAAVRAAVLAPETELRGWFSWQWYWTDSLVDDLIGQGRLRRIDGHVTVAGQSPPRQAPPRPAASLNPA
jgi:hypothetical protein